MGNESKLVVVGAGGVGKSAISVRFVQGKFVPFYDPSILDKYRKQVQIDGRTEIVEIVDTAGQEEYRSMRAQYYEKGEGFVVVYSITDRGSMGEVEKLRDDILEEKGCSCVPMVLVGNKCDLETERKVTKSEGEALARNWFRENKGIPFFESSAKDAINIDECIHQIVRELRSQKATPVHELRPQKVLQECQQVVPQERLQKVLQERQQVVPQERPQKVLQECQQVVPQERLQKVLQERQQKVTQKQKVLQDRQQVSQKLSVRKKWNCSVM
eukprot:TRINITY_DN388_c4_g1_i1.p1 TRINITY_DN388_c4_g1~~TRINITY_DN388_c4_g1_i1.p1  ORF type:complete len:271 (+),score=44.67 TRINITY_DN388_c4_g1_i1:51-863(+)